MRIFSGSLNISLLCIFFLFCSKIFAQDSFERGKKLYSDGRLDEAIVELNSTINDKLKLPEVYLYLGNVYAAKVDFDQAIQNYAKAIEIKPDFALAYYNCAVAYYAKQDYKLAWESLHKSKDLGYQPHVEFLEQLKEDTGRTE